MALADDIIHRDPLTIIVNREGRQRQRDLNIDDLIPSIRARGILHPIIINDDLTLMSGERRLKTAIHLQLATVPTRLYSTLDPAEAELVEQEENLRRKDLAWQDKALSFLRLHELYGAGKEEWSVAQTAQLISYEERYVERMVDIATAIRGGDTIIAGADSFSAANTIMVRRNDRRGAAAIASLMEIERQPMTPAQPTVPEGIAEGGDAPAPVFVEPAPFIHPCRIENTDFTQWAPLYAGPRFNFLHLDFPYGVELNGQAHQDSIGEYDGGVETYWELLLTLNRHFDKLMLPSAHVMCWISMKHYTESVQKLREMGVTTNPVPLIWHKTDNRGILPDPLRGPRQTYEACLIGSVGDRKIVKPVSNSYGAPTGKSDAIHTNEKPEAMLSHFLSMFVDEHTRMLDPTAGSGSAVRAAEALGAESALGLELDPEFSSRAQQALVTARGLRQLSSKAAANG